MGMKLGVLDDLGMRIYGYLMFRHENIWVFDVWGYGNEVLIWAQSNSQIWVLQTFPLNSILVVKIFSGAVTAISDVRYFLTSTTSFISSFSLSTSLSNSVKWMEPVYKKNTVMCISGHCSYDMEWFISDSNYKCFQWDIPIPKSDSISITAGSVGFPWKSTQCHAIYSIPLQFLTPFHAILHHSNTIPCQTICQPK